MLKWAQIYLCVWTIALSACAASNAGRNDSQPPSAGSVASRNFTPVYCPADDRALRDVFRVGLDRVLVQVGEWPMMPPMPPGYQGAAQRMLAEETVEDAVNRIGRPDAGMPPWLFITEDEYQTRREQDSVEDITSELWCTESYSDPPQRGRP